MTGQSSLQEQYAAFWSQAQTAFAGGSVTVDTHLAAKSQDRRRGATLIARPNAAVAERVSQVLAQIAIVAPEQYYYRAQELHVTVLSLFTVSEQPEPYLAQLPTYRSAIDSVLARVPAFSIRFDGFTATPSAIMVQGFPCGCRLDELREALRCAIQEAGLGQNLDQRYRIATAHMTTVRFVRPPHNLPALVAKLQTLRHCELGETRINAVQLVQNDWYMSQDKTRLLHTYPMYDEAVV